MNAIIPHTPQNSLERREIARTAMLQYEGYGKFMYLLHSPFVRKGSMPDGTIYHSAIDAINILADSTDEPRKLWNDTKKRLLKDDKDMSEKIRHISLPLWNDKSGRYRMTDAMTNSGLVILVFELHTQTSNEVRRGIAEIFDRYKPELHATLINELEREIGWAGTETKLLMASIYEEGDYEHPIVPPGSLP